MVLYGSSTVTINADLQVLFFTYTLKNNMDRSCSRLMLTLKNMPKTSHKSFYKALSNDRLRLWNIYISETVNEADQVLNSYLLTIHFAILTTFHSQEALCPSFMLNIAGKD